MLSLRQVTFRTETGEEVGPIEVEVTRASRIWVDCPSDSLFTAFAAILTGERKPLQGYLEEINPVVVQSDFHLKETLSPNRPIADYLNSPDAPEFVWLERRRRSLGVLVDQLGLMPDKLRFPFKHQPPEVFTKYWALRFLISRADLLIGREIFNLDDPDIQAALRKRWADFPGAVVAATGRERLPGPVDLRLSFGADGSFSSEAYRTQPI